MKVLMIAPTNFFSHRGCHVRIFEEIRSLQNKNLQIKTVTYQSGDNVENFDIERIRKYFWFGEITTGPNLHKLYLDFFLLLKTFSVIRKYKPDIIHCHLHEGVVIGLIVNLFFKKKLIFDSQGSFVSELESHNFLKHKSIIYKLLFRFEALVYKYSSQIIVSNQINFNLLIEQFNISSKKINIIADGIDTDKIIVNKQMVKTLRDQLNLPISKKIIIYLGTLNQLEGIDDLLLLTKELSKKRSDFILLILGYPNVDYYNKIVKDYKLDNMVKLLGKIDYSMIYKYLSLADFTISLKQPSSEGNGKLLNYGALGLPIICYDLPNNNYILENTGLYLSFNDNLDKKTSRLNEYLDLPSEKLNEISQKSKHLILNKFDWSNIAEKLIKIYQK